MNRRRFLKKAGLWVPAAVAFPGIVRAQRNAFTSPSQTANMMRRHSVACSTVKDSNVPGAVSAFTACGNAAASTYIASKFTTGSAYSCCAIELYIDKQGSTAAPTGNVTASFYADGGSGPTGSALATSNSVDATTMPAKGAPAWVKFSLPSPYSLTTATVYWIVVTGVVINVNSFIGANYPSTFVSGGTYASPDATTWTAGAARRWFFQTYA